MPRSAYHGCAEGSMNEIDSFQKYVIAMATLFRHFEWGHGK